MLDDGKRFGAILRDMYPSETGEVNLTITAGWGSFSGCTGLTRVTIPGSVKWIRDRAFTDRSPRLEIAAPAGSAAEEFARENRYTFRTV